VFITIDGLLRLGGFLKSFGRSPLPSAQAVVDLQGTTNAPTRTDPLKYEKGHGARITAKSPTAPKSTLGRLPIGSPTDFCGYWQRGRTA
jgi:hypothetical protein